MPRPSDPNARIKLLAAAEAIFAARGLDEAKVEDIAARAGLGKGSFYLHFDSKDDAFRQLVEMMLVKMKAQIEVLTEDCAGPQGATLAQMLDQWVDQDVEIFEFVWRNRALVGLMLEGGRCAAYRHLIDGFCDEAVEKTKRLVRRGIQAGIYRADLDVDVTAAFIGGAYDRLARQIVRQPRRPELAQMLRRVQFLVLRGVASAATMEQLAHLQIGEAGLPLSPPRRELPQPQVVPAGARAARTSKRPPPRLPLHPPPHAVKRAGKTAALTANKTTSLTQRIARKRASR